MLTHIQNTCDFFKSQPLDVPGLQHFWHMMDIYPHMTDHLITLRNSLPGYPSCSMNQPLPCLFLYCPHGLPTIWPAVNTYRHQKKSKVI